MRSAIKAKAPRRTVAAVVAAIASIRGQHGPVSPPAVPRVVADGAPRTAALAGGAAVPVPRSTPPARGSLGRAFAAAPVSEEEREANERRREEAGGAGSSSDWQWTLNWDAVTPDERVLVGSCPRTPADVERLAAEAGPTAVLCLQCDDCHRALQIDGDAIARRGAELGLKMVRVPIRDFDHGDQGLMLPEAVRVLASLLESGHRVYVHCTAGINRASLVTVGWLTFVEGLHLEAAVEQVKSRRQQAHPYLDSWHAAKNMLLEPHGARLTALAEA